MERILLVKRIQNIEVWSIDITDLPIEKVVEFVENERPGDDIQVKRKTFDEYVNEIVRGQCHGCGLVGDRTIRKPDLCPHCNEDMTYDVIK